MSSRNFFLICTIVGSLLLFIFVSPQWVNKGLKKSNIGYELSSRPFRLGLDLLGGTHLVYQADLSKVQGDKDDALQGVRDVVERRGHLFGGSEPPLQTPGHDGVLVE